MTLLEALAAGPVTERRCKLGAWIDSLTPEEAAAIRDAILTKPQRWVARVISAHGHPVSPSTIEGHRLGNCVTCSPWTGTPS